MGAKLAELTGAQLVQFDRTRKNWKFAAGKGILLQFHCSSIVLAKLAISRSKSIIFGCIFLQSSFRLKTLSQNESFPKVLSFVCVWLHVWPYSVLCCKIFVRIFIFRWNRNVVNMLFCWSQGTSAFKFLRCLLCSGIPVVSSLARANPMIKSLFVNFIC